MLINLIRSGFSLEMLTGVAASLLVLLFTLPVHEYAHAWMAHKLGDDTARLSGRLTLNPMAHLDPLGSILILLVGFGYAKPVPVNIRNFKKRKKYMALTALAGPMSNLIMALIFLIISNIPFYFFDFSITVVRVIYYLLYYLAFINVSLALFNLLPIPPLDGSRIFTAVLPDKYYYTVMQYERYIMIGLFVLLLTGTLTRPLSFLSKYLFLGIEWLADLPFKPFV